MTKFSDGKVFTAGSLSLATKDSQAQKDPELLYGRKLHKICGVWDL